MIKELRDFFSLTQEDLAIFLTITRSRLNMIERNERNLSTEKLHSLVPFSRLIDESKAGTLKENIVENEEVKKNIESQKQNSDLFFKSRLSECNYKVARAQRNLAILKENRLKCMKVWSVIPFLKEKVSPQQDYLINKITDYALEMQTKTGIDTQLKMEARLAGLKAEIEFLEKQLAE